MEWSHADVELVDIAWLKPHEEVRTKHLEQLRRMTIRWGGYTRPILVDAESGVILDGHHRYNVGLMLGLKRIPALLCDYLNDAEIQVTLWPNSELKEICKQDVIDKAMAGEVFPAKTSRHLLAKDIPPILIPLDILME